MAYFFTWALIAEEDRAPPGKLQLADIAPQLRHLHSRHRPHMLFLMEKGLFHDVVP